MVRCHTHPIMFNYLTYDDLNWVCLWSFAIFGSGRDRVGWRMSNVPARASLKVLSRHLPIESEGKKTWETLLRMVVRGLRTGCPTVDLKLELGSRGLGKRSVSEKKSASCGQVH